MKLPSFHGYHKIPPSLSRLSWVIAIEHEFILKRAVGQFTIFLTEDKSQTPLIPSRFMPNCIPKNGPRSAVSKSTTRGLLSLDLCSKGCSGNYPILHFIEARTNPWSLGGPFDSYVKYILSHIRKYIYALTIHDSYIHA